MKLVLQILVAIVLLFVLMVALAATVGLLIRVVIIVAIIAAVVTCLQHVIANRKPANTLDEKAHAKAEKAAEKRLKELERNANE